MKKQGFKSLAYAALAGLFVTSCNQLKDLDYTVTPDPLEMHGDSIKVKVDIKFPEKGIRKKAYAEITPKIGDHALKTVTVVGEKATANGTVVPFKAGGKVVYEDFIPYKADMEHSELVVTGTVFKGSKEKGEIDETKIADATIVTPFWVNKDFRVIFAEDNFQRVTEESYDATINYLKNRFEVRNTELRKEDIVEMEKFLANAQGDAKIEIKNIKITGFASIEGEEDLNNTLSQNRAQSAMQATSRIAGKRNVGNEFAQEESSFSTAGKGEDYEGFKNALIASDMDKGEKDLILRILEMYASPAQREKEIRNLGKTFTYLDKNIFPEQRRSEISIVYDKIGYSDEELVAISKSEIRKLNVEEILFTATLTEDLNEKLRLYQEAEKLFPNDYRAVNNVGTVLYMQNKLNEAKSQFEKANNLQDNAISKNNLAAIAGVNDDRKKTKALLAESGNAAESNYNRGIIAIQEGRYDDAISNFGGESTFNKALAAALKRDLNTATSSINGSADAESAQGYYLKAIIGARKDNLSDVVSNLKSAFAKDASLKSKAAKDREFVKYFDDQSFTSIVK